VAEFGSFLKKRERDNKEKLKLLGLILKKAGFDVHPHLDVYKDPHLFIAKPEGLGEYVDDLSFDGIRIFMRGKDIVCFRSQMKNNAMPFGETYLVDVSGMYRDLMDDDEKKAPYRVIYYVIQELRDFFIQSGHAEADVPPEYEDGQQGMITGGTGTDYSNTVSDLRGYGGSRK
jgi:hypothetical protein